MPYFPPPPESAIDKLDQQAESLARCLDMTQLHLVLAESCTAGLVAGTLGGVPGASAWLCGSAVVYQDETKRNWLAVPDDQITEWGTVAASISDILAKNVLNRTPQADLAVAVTGHLGPDAPTDLDGMVYIAIRFRNGRCQFAECRLPIGNGTPVRQRRDRQKLCTAFVLDRIQDACEENFDETAPSVR